LLASSFHLSNGVYDIESSESNMLNSRTSIKINIFLNLWLLFTFCWLVDWHFDFFIKIGYNHWSECRILSMEHFVINWPESVEIKHFFIPRSSSFHFSIWLISNAVINEFKLWWLNKRVINLLKWMFDEFWKELSIVLISLDKCMSCVTVCSNGRHDNKTTFIFKFSWFHYTCCTSFGCFFVNTSSIIDCESNIFNSVTMFSEVCIEFFMPSRV